MSQRGIDYVNQTDKDQVDIGLYSQMDSQILDSLIEPKLNAQSFYNFQGNIASDLEPEVVRRFTVLQDKIVEFQERFPFHDINIENYL